MDHPDTISSGVEGLDQVLAGGFPRGRLYLLEGGAGSGKTTLGLQFLLEGVRNRDPVLYIVLSEGSDEVRQVAKSHGWSVDGITILELAPGEGNWAEDEQYTVFHPSEVQLDETTKVVFDEVERVKPVRLVLDSINGLRLLAQNPVRYRQQVLALKRMLTRRGCTGLLLDDQSGQTRDLQLRSIVHGIISLDRLAPRYGAVRRQLEVSKLRGVKFRDGYHDFGIRKGGLIVFPRIVVAEHHRDFEPGVVSSGLAPLDKILGGGLYWGTSTVILGPAGAGKSTLATQYAVAAAGRGEPAVIYTFDETIATFLSRSAGLGLDVQTHRNAGRIHIHQVNPAELSQGEFAHELRLAVEQHGARVVVIDSLNGYLNALPDKDLLTVQMHELLTYLDQRGILTILIVAQHGLVGDALQSPVDISYLADSVLLLRYFEAFGEIKQAISVFKKRTGGHGRTLREMHLGPDGISIGDPLQEFQGVMTGVPQIVVRGRKVQAAEDSDHAQD